MSIELIKKFFALKALAAPYDELFGAECPFCHGQKIPITSTRNEGSATIRFHKCPKCGATFKSVEKLEKPVPKRKRRQNDKALLDGS
ncbi:MAG: hypothetical protein HQM08_29260 [Candidatus Riflebacteria bacterium]|nr:hypothetical protein [Candidatus Riflebacteria bacterium]